MKITVDFGWNLGQDQAVLAEVIGQSHALNHRLGRTALQKIIYFLKRKGVPVAYSFDLYQYGPFCQEILWDAEMLASMDVVVDKGGYKGGSSYEAGSEFETHLVDHQEFLDTYSDVIKDVVALLSGLSAPTLEAAATLDYFYRYVSASDAPQPRKPKVLEHFFEAKPKYLANRKSIEDLYDQMAKINMVGP